MFQLRMFGPLIRPVWHGALIAIGCAALALMGTQSVTSYAERSVDSDQDELASDEASVDDAAGAVKGIYTIPNGRVLGQVEATLGGQPIALPGATVSLEHPHGHRRHGPEQRRGPLRNPTRPDKPSRSWRRSAILTATGCISNGPMAERVSSQ